MDENYFTKTRQTRQLLAELNKLSGRDQKYDMVQQTQAKPYKNPLELHRANSLKIIQSTTKEDAAALFNSELLVHKSAGTALSLLELQRLRHLSCEFTQKCPPGLQYLLGLDALYVVQETESLELMTEVELVNKFMVQNYRGDRLYCAVERSTTASKLCLCSRRPFELSIFNSDSINVLNINRHFSCTLQKATIYSPPGVSIGTVEEQYACTGSLFVVKNDTGETLQKLSGPACSFLRCGRLNVFHVYAYDGVTKLGTLSNKWEQFGEEVYSNTQSFVLNFPVDLDALSKARLLGASFLISIMMYGST